jgi:hypothetical protein
MKNASRTLAAAFIIGASALPMQFADAFNCPMGGNMFGTDPGQSTGAAYYGGPFAGGGPWGGPAYGGWGGNPAYGYGYPGYGAYGYHAAPAPAPMTTR